MHRALIWLITLGFIPGIVCGFLVIHGWWVVTWIWLMSMMTAITGVIYHNRNGGLIVAIILFSLGAGVGCVNISPFPSSLLFDERVGTRSVIHGIVMSEPDVREQMLFLTVHPDQLVGMDGSVVSINDSVRILVSIPNPYDVSYGDRIEVDGVLTRPDTFLAHDTYKFEYPDFLAIRGIGYTISFARVQVLEHQARHYPLWQTLYSVKSWYLHGIALSLPEPHAALAGGITVGDKRSLGESLTHLFQVTGMSHVVVLSGYNITVIASSIMWLLSCIVSVTIASWCGIIAIALFVGMAGASGVAVRAGIMAAIVLIARLSRRPYAAPRALAIASIIMLAYEPRLLLFDPGFQLSIAATLGLLFISPLIKYVIVRVPERFGLRNIFADTLGTQISVTPLLIYQTGMFSLVALPVNMIVLPIVPFAMAVAMIGGIVGGIAPMVGIFFGAPAYVALSYILVIVKWIGALPYAAIAINIESIVILSCVYGVIITLVAYTHLRARRTNASMVVLLQNVAQRHSN